MKRGGGGGGGGRGGKRSSSNSSKHSSQPARSNRTGKNDWDGDGDSGRKADNFAKLSTTKREEAEIKDLTARLLRESPEPGASEIAVSEFGQLPMSRYTLTGLQRSKYRILTQIQRVAIPHGLAGCVARTVQTPLDT